MSMKSKLCVAVVFFIAANEAAALSCPELDPYEAVESAYNNSDLVFLGRVEESESFVGHAPEIFIEAKWKGPEILSIKMHRSLWGPGDARVFFAARSDEPLGWSDRYPDCFPRRSKITIEQVLTEILGEPSPPSEDAITGTYLAFLGVLLAAAGGVAVFAWTSKLK